MEKIRKNRIAKQKKSLTDKGRDEHEYLLLTAPFNFCDRHCERCDQFRGNCEVYQEESRFKLQCVMNGNDPADPKVIFEHIGKSMRQMMKMFKKKLEKEGVEITEEDMEMFEIEESEKDKALEKYPLYLQCQTVEDGLQEFLATFRISLPGIKCIIASVEREVKEMYFYSPMIVIKTARALLLEEESVELDNSEKKLIFSDKMVSAALGYSSLVTSMKSLKIIGSFIGEEELVWKMKINTLLAQMAKTKELFKQTFSGVENYAQNVIFHGRHK